MKSRRLLCVQLPMWPIDRLRRRLERKRRDEGGAMRSTDCASEQAQSVARLFLISTRGNVQHVAACCRASQQAGVRAGMTLAQGRALVGSAVHVEEFDPAAERAAIKRLAGWASLRYSPLVSVDPCSLHNRIGAEELLPDGIVLDITGCERLFGGEERLARHMVQALGGAGFEARAGIGPTMGAAWAAARFGTREPGELCILSSEFHALRRQLEAMPVRALRIEPSTEQSLVELGLETIGHVLSLPRATLPSRFGSLLVRRIDQALGSAIETFEPVRPRPLLRLERLFDGPTPQQEAIESATRELLVDLSRELLKRESGVRVLEAQFERIGRNGRGTEVLRERLTLSAPSRAARHLWSLLRPRVEKLHLGYGIESIALVALRLGRLRHRQQEYVEERHQGNEASRHEAGELIDTLVNRLGPERVLRGELVESHVPQRAARFVPALEGPGRRSAPLMAPELRPTVLFDHPEPAEAIAMGPDRPPRLLRWRGRERRIVASFGPERIAGEWWRASSLSSDAWERDYFRVCDEGGRWLWVYREVPLFCVQDVPRAAAPRWFVHGVWA
jgi:protein ImuB